MAEVILKDVKKTYEGGFEAVKGASLEIADREFVVLVGPSGCGKSTTLRMIAGLEEITAGSISIGERVVNDIPPKDRDIAMVFQNYALYPHMTVFENMAFGLKLRKYPKLEIQQRVQEAAQILGIQELLSRKPKALSGGQRQRVAVGRAIVRKPAAFLFDEPLSNLDAKLRVEMRLELNKLHRRLATTMIYVTHDQIEAMTLGDRIVIMDQGLIQQVANPTSLYDDPVNHFVASFIGTPPMNFLEGVLESSADGLLFDGGNGLRVPLREPWQQGERVRARVGRPVRMGLRPEYIRDRSTAALIKAPVAVQAKVDVVESLGDEKLVYFSEKGHQFIGKADPHTQLTPGAAIELLFDSAQIRLFDKESGENLTCRVSPYQAPDRSRLPHAGA